MKAMARGNPVVQERLFDRLDMMLGIVGAEAEMAVALIEVGSLGHEELLLLLEKYAL